MFVFFKLTFRFFCRILCHVPYVVKAAVFHLCLRNSTYSCLQCGYANISVVSDSLSVTDCYNGLAVVL